ncbi:MotE family protein [Bacillus sp. V5-8f]|uniref:MotE family protein n=1 Tax=Bacillus sp. V5-8f TaxID=2053044 RepID=UPI000C77A0F6|nr:MotE family protein [Bacillus sp. V5-8f]PLT34210.1 hypothetical protein CUU64_08230 [Bacillus sp. V5-8f]
MEKPSENEEKEYNRFQWFIFVVLIPLIFTIAIVLIVLTVAGVNVLDEGKKIGEKLPFVSSMVNKGDNEKGKAESTVQYEKKLTELEAEIDKNQDEIMKLEEMVDSRDQTIERNELEKEQLQKQIDELQGSQDDSKQAFNEIIRTYETMSAKKAAPIITKLGDDEAVKILSSIKADTLAGIMEQMEPEDAARLTNKLAESSTQEN